MNTVGCTSSIESQKAPIEEEKRAEKVVLKARDQKKASELKGKFKLYQPSQTGLT